jgi:poly(A) polymerase
MSAPLSRLEWDNLLTADQVDLALERTVASGALEAVFPELYALVGFGGGDSGHKDLWDHTKIVVRQTLRQPILRWAALFHDCGKPQCFEDRGGVISFHYHEEVSAQMFKRAGRRSQLFTESEVQRIASIIRLLGKVETYRPEWSDSAVRRLGRDLGELVDDVLAVARADCSSKYAERRRAAKARCHALKTRLAALAKQDATPPALPRGLGDAVMRHLGFTAETLTSDQGREMKRVMGALRALVESGELPRSAKHEVYLAVLPSL